MRTKPLTFLKKTMLAPLANGLAELFNVLPTCSAQQRRAFAAVTLTLSFVACLSASTSQAVWNYPKPQVLDYLANWRTQLMEDRYLELTERDLRIEFLNRLTFQVDRKYSDQDFKSFLIETTSAALSAEEQGVTPQLEFNIEFLKNLSRSLSEVIEPSENILSFLRSFIEFSTLKNPQSFDAFADSRSYSNGLQAESARSMTLDEAARQALQETPQAFE